MSFSPAIALPPDALPPREASGHRDFPTTASKAAQPKISFHEEKSSRKHAVKRGGGCSGAEGHSDSPQRFSKWLGSLAGSVSRYDAPFSPATDENAWAAHHANARVALHQRIAAQREAVHMRQTDAMLHAAIHKGRKY